MRICAAYGLGISSEIPLPELVAARGDLDVIVRLGRVDLLPPPAAARGASFWVTPEEVCLSYDKVGAFLVRGGREILVDPAPGVEEDVLRLFLLGPALAILLHQRGFLVLHASTAAVNGGAVAFLGGPGWGKSTIAAALHARGHGVAADDITAIRLDAERPLVVPGSPQLKLWPEPARALGYSPEALPPPQTSDEKCALRVTRGFPRAPIPLAAIFVLADSGTPAVEPLRPQEAFLELVRHSYCARLLKAVGASAHFLQCASIARSVTMRRLRMPQSLTALPDLVSLVEADLDDKLTRPVSSTGRRRLPDLVSLVEADLDDT